MSHVGHFNGEKVQDVIYVLQRGGGRSGEMAGSIVPGVGGKTFSSPLICSSCAQEGGKS